MGKAGLYADPLPVQIGCPVCTPLYKTPGVTSGTLHVHEHVVLLRWQPSA